ncbi:MAG TPA: DUF6034 family protein [Clostridia bacterium]|nr:DUF6034 family protein [Clostridia bacterium]
MKRLLALILITAILLTACQKTPEADIVVQKNTEQMIEATKETPEAAETVTLAEAYEIPETLSYSEVDADGKLRIEVDAPIELPSVNMLPVARVNAVDFSQEIVSLMFGRLCGGYEMLETPQKSTKKQIEHDITGLEKELENPEYQDDERLLAEFKQMIEQLKREYPTAPEAVEPVRSEGILQEFTVKDQKNGAVICRYMGVRAYCAGKVGFSVVNNDDLKEMYVTREESGIVYGGRAVRRGAYMLFSLQEKLGNYGQHTMLRIADESAVPDEAEGFLSVTPAEARSRVQALLEGMDMKVWDVFLTDDENLGNYDGIVSDAAHYAYKFLCVREVNGVNCTYLTSDSSIAGDLTSPSWYYENMQLMADDEGVFDMSWQSPLNVTEIVSENARLLSFPSIREIFRKMICIKYEPKARAEHNENVRVCVDRIVLSLQRVSEQNSYETGLLVPVWNFYGRVFTISAVTGKDDSSDFWEGASESLLTVNAIDGSIIDPLVGY